MPKRKYNINHAIAAYEDIGFEFLEKEYTTIHKKYWTKCYKCKILSYKEAGLAFYKSGGCLTCSGLAKKTLEDIETLFKNAKITLLATEIINTNTPHAAKCDACGHEWDIRPADVKQGYGCPACADNLPWTMAEIEDLCGSYGIVFKSEIYENANTKYPAYCTICENNIFVRVHDLDQGHGCVVCAHINQMVDSEEVLRRFAKQSLKLLSEYKGSVVDHEILCLKCNSIITMRPATVFGGHGCSNCVAFKNEQRARQFLQELLGRADIHRFTINCNDETIRNRLFCDASLLIDNVRFIVEYNGIQHYQPVYFYGTSDEVAVRENFERQVRRDEWLRKYCKENNIVLIEIDGREYKGDKIRTYLIEEFTRLGFGDYITKDKK